MHFLLQLLPLVEFLFSLATWKLQHGAPIFKYRVIFLLPPCTSVQERTENLKSRNFRQKREIQKLFFICYVMVHDMISVTGKVLQGVGVHVNVLL